MSSQNVSLLPNASNYQMKNTSIYVQNDIFCVAILTAEICHAFLFIHAHNILPLHAGTKLLENLSLIQSFIYFIKVGINSMQVAFMIVNA